MPVMNILWVRIQVKLHRFGADDFVPTRFSRNILALIRLTSKQFGDNVKTPLCFGQSRFVANTFLRKFIVLFHEKLKKMNWIGFTW